MKRNLFILFIIFLFPSLVLSQNTTRKAFMDSAFANDGADNYVSIIKFLQKITDDSIGSDAIKYNSISKTRLNSNVKKVVQNYLAPIYSYGYGDSLLFVKLTSTDSLYFDLPLPNSLFGGTFHLDSIEVHLNGDASSSIDYFRIYSNNFGSLVSRYEELTDFTCDASNQTATYTTNIDLQSDQSMLLFFKCVINTDMKIFSFKIYGSVQ